MDSFLHSKPTVPLNNCWNLQNRQLHGQLLNNAICGLTFSQEVIRERGTEGARYSQTDFSRLFQASGILGTQIRSTKDRKRCHPKHLCRLTVAAGHKESRTTQISLDLLSSHVRPPTDHVSCLWLRRTLLDSLQKTGSQRTSIMFSSLEEGPTREMVGGTKTSQKEEFTPMQPCKTSSQQAMTQGVTSQSPTQCPLQSLQRHRHNSTSVTKLCGEKPVREEDLCSSEQHKEDYQKNISGSSRPAAYSVLDFYASPAYTNESMPHSVIKRATETGSVKVAPASNIHCVCQSENTADKDSFSAGVWHRPRPHASSNHAAERGLAHIQDMEAPQLQAWHVAMPERSRLCHVVQEWRRAWNIETPRHNVTIEGLRKDFADLHCHVRLVAVATCAWWAINMSGKQNGSITPAWHGSARSVRPPIQQLQPLLLLALHDPAKVVQMAAALCHYTMGVPNDRAREIFRGAVHEDSSGVGADSWAAAQCLAIEGDSSQPVIQRLLSQHFLGQREGDREQATALLLTASRKTTLVRSLLAEELNCANCRYKAQACSTISKLEGPINKDVVNKLLYLLWNDWSGEVRQAAAKALGKLGMGREVHNELRVKLEDGPSSWKVEALIHLAQQQIMTARLLPGFLGCLRDSSKAVRKQACVSAAALRVEDQRVLDQLTELMQNDPTWEVKIAAMNALSQIGCLTPTLQELLFRALRHETEPQVRIAACEALAALGVHGQELQYLLEERYALEPHLQVKRHIERLIKNYGYSLEGDTGVIHKVKQQVQKLCTKHTITEKVLLIEELVHAGRKGPLIPWHQQGCHDETRYSILTSASSSPSQDAQIASCNNKQCHQTFTQETEHIKPLSITKRENWQKT